MPRGRGGRGKHYPKDLKQSAVELALSGEKPVTQIANDLGMSAKTLHNWIRVHREKTGEVQPLNTKNERAWKRSLNGYEKRMHC